MATLDDLKESVEKVLGERKLNPKTIIREAGKAVHFSAKNVVDYLCSPEGFFNCGFSPENNNPHVYRLYLGLHFPQATEETIKTINSIIDIRNDLRNGHSPDFIMESNAKRHYDSVSSEREWQILERWPLGFTLEEFLDDQITISDAEKNMQKALDYLLDWEEAVFSQLILTTDTEGPEGGTTMNDYIESKIELLKSSKNLILTGAPGTGKTYLARQIAQKMMEDISNSGDHIGFVQFHPSYDYTDFVEGLRPFGTGQIGFERRDGVFKAFCKEALENTKEPYVFIIDEINRGEISKIFGELFFSIEASYRGEKGRVQTQYTNQIADDDVFKPGFYIPENVYIIGTMNDIDRSVESFDFAMRRRFVWEEVTAKDSFINMGLGSEAAYEKSKMKKLNDVIQKIPELNSSYHIGGQYFLNMQSESALWKLRLKPLLREYLRGLDAGSYWDKLEKSETIDDFLKASESNDGGGQEQ